MLLVVRYRYALVNPSVLSLLIVLEFNVYCAKIITDGKGYQRNAKGGLKEHLPYFLLALFLPSAILLEPLPSLSLTSP